MRTNIQQTDESFRKTFNFNNDWLFSRVKDKPPHIDQWERITLPHTVRLEPKEWVDSASFQGISWYWRNFTIDPAYKGKKIFVKFEGAMINADVWVNDQHLTSHKGGYLPFTIDLTDVVIFGENNIITVKVDSRDDWETPPGKPQSELDFVYFGGLYRNAQLIITDPVHITDAIAANKVANGGVFITYPEVSEERAMVRIQSHVQNDCHQEKQVSIEATIIDPIDQTIASSGKSESYILPSEENKTFVQTLTMTHPKLWSMDHPHLYTAVLKVYEGNRQVDQYQLQIGIRKIEFTADKGFFINDEQVLLNGVNHHEDYLYVGNAVSESMLYRDVKMIKEAGFNLIRAGHYPHHQAFMDACDELGIAVIVPTPGWQYYTEKGNFEKRSIQMTREMIRLYRNHPSVVVWEPILNETWYPESFAKAAYQAVHEEYPTDQAYAAADFGLPYGKHFDVVYKEAYSETKPLITREWGDANHNLYDGERSGRKFGERSLINSSIHRQNSLKGNKWKDEHEEDGYWDWAGLNANKRIAGYALWSFNDYNRGMSKEIAYSGIVDRDRYPKFNYYWFQSQQAPNESYDPMIFIANHWHESSPRDVHIYTNTEEVKLYLNDQYIGTKKHPTVPHINHPIIIFENVPWEQGVLRAEGLINNEVVTTHTVMTPEDPHHLSIVFDPFSDHELVADGSDMIMAYVLMKDKHGNTVPTSEKDISLHLTGPGILVGNGEERVKANPVRTEAGIAPVLIRSTLTPGEITITATTSGLQVGQAVIKSVPYQGQFVPSKNDKEIPCIKGTNIALHKPITVSSEQEHNKGIHINDGKHETYWLPSESDENPWIRIDLEENFNLLGLQILGTSKQSFKNYKIDVSEDQVQWITMIDHSNNKQHKQTQFERFASNARYVRIHLFEHEANEGISEIKIFGNVPLSHNFSPTRKRKNIATGKTIHASSFSPGNEPAMVVNQALNTMWQADTYHLPQWLQVDLGECQSVSGAKIWWGKDSTHYTYKIQVSKDKQNWLDVVDQTTTGSHYHPIDFNADDIRYVRVYIDNLMAGGGAEKVAIKALEIYGT